MFVFCTRSIKGIKVRGFAGLVLISLLMGMVFGQGPTPTPTPTPQPLATPLPSSTPDEPMPTQRSYDKPLPPLPDPSRVGVSSDNQLSLALDQAIEMALKNNNDIDASRDTARIADYNVRGAQGIYDPLFN